VGSVAAEQSAAVAAADFTAVAADSTAVAVATVVADTAGKVNRKSPFFGTGFFLCRCGRAI
jgi:hypothetical protein